MTAPVDLVASSVAAPLAAEVAGIAPERVRRLVLIAPFGMYDDADPTTDIWAQRPGPDVLPALLCNAPETLDASMGNARRTKTRSNGEFI